MHKSLKTLAVGLALSLLSACAIDDGRGWGELELSTTGGIDVPAGRYDTALKAYNSADDYRIQIDSFDYQITRVSLLASGGGSISFDPENPPPPYTNCHAGHCHRTDSDTTESFEEIEAKLNSNGAASATAVFEQVTEISDSFVTPKTDLTILHGELDRGRVNGLAVEVNDIDIKGKYQKKNDVNWQTFSYQQSPHHVIKINTKTDINVDRGEDYRIKCLAKLDLSLNFIDFRNWDDLPNDAAMHADLQKSLKLSLIKQ